LRVISVGIYEKLRRQSLADTPIYT